MNSSERVTVQPHPASAFAAATPAVAHESTFDGIHKTLWRHRWVVVSAVLFSTSLAVAYLAHAKPTYASSSLVYLEQTPSRLFGAGNISISETYLHAQCELLRSGPILSDALALLDEEAATHAGPPAPAREPTAVWPMPPAAEAQGAPAMNAARAPSEVPPAVTPSQPPAAEPAVEAGSSERVEELRNGLDVSLGRDDGMITVTCESPDPRQCARVANAVVRAYVRYEARHQKLNAAEVSSILQREKDKREGELAGLRRALVDFEKSHSALSFETDRGNIVTERLARLADQLTEARLQTLERSARYRALRLAAGLDPDRAPVLPRAWGSGSAGPVEAGSLREGLGRAELELQEMMSRLPPENPRVRTARAYVERVRRLVADADAAASARDMGAARQEVEAAEEHERQVQKAFDEQRAAATQLGARAAEYAKLRNDVDRVQKMSEALDTQIRSVSVSEDANPTRARVLESAQPVLRPVRPHKGRILSMAAVLGLLGGVGLSMLLEVVDQRLRSPEDVRNALGLPVLGNVPHVPGKVSPSARGTMAFWEPMSHLAESCRSVRTAIYFSARTARIKTLLVASSNSAEGKSTFIGNLAIAMAQAGRRTLVIDADCRKPSLQKVFSVPGGAGLSELLTGRVELDAALSPTKVPDLHVLPCGPLPPNPSEMLNGQPFADLLQRLSGQYDHILLDSPPVLAVTDARILGAVCDVTVFVVRAGVTSKKSAEQALESLQSVGSRILGVVVNDVPVRRGQKGVYGVERCDPYVDAGVGEGPRGSLREEHPRRDVGPRVPLLPGGPSRPTPDADEP